MERLTRSFDAYLMSMRMSRKTLFVFVEGSENDPYFYGSICDKVLVNKNIEYELCKASTLKSTHGGKSVLLEFHSYLKQNKSLNEQFFGKLTIVHFFLDKDVDDLVGTLVDCKHICYTRNYDIESEIFSFTNLITAASAALCVQTTKIPEVKAEELKKIFATNWKEWVKLCYFSHQKELSCGCGFSRFSDINDHIIGPVDTTKLEYYKEKLRLELGATQDEFIELYRILTWQIEILYQADIYDIFFKGKWFVYMFYKYLETYFVNEKINFKGFIEKFYSAMRTLIDFDDYRYDHYKKHISEHL